MNQKLARIDSSLRGMGLAGALALLAPALFAVVLFTASCATAPPLGSRAVPLPVPQAADTEDARLLTEVMDAVWERQIEDSLYFRMQLGLPIEHLPRLSLEQARDDAAFAQAQLDRLDAVDTSQLGHDQRLSLGLVRWELDGAVEALAFHWLSWPITPYASPLPTIQRAFTSSRFESADDLRRYEALIEDYPRVLGEIQTHLEGQYQRKIVLPQPELEVVIPFLQTMLAPPKESPFYVAGERLSAIEAEQATQFQARIERVIDREINGQLLRILHYLSNEYERAAPAGLGLSQYPDGADYYRFLMRRHTTLDLTPQQVHERGLAEVERIEKAMTKVRTRMGSAGPKSSFHSMLRSNQRLVATTSDQIGERLMSYVEKIEPRIDELFGRLPKAPYGVQALPDGLAGAMTYGYYQTPTEADPRGYYYFNGSQPESRSLLWAQSLIYHELVPGHHFQLALQFENDAAHPLRRYSTATAFVEGWAEYASELGKELGLYQNLDLYGRYVAEIFLASRLVVDTGIHAEGWSRQRAIEYMSEHTMESPIQIATETLRYGIDIPAQALAYKLGAITLWDLRHKAERELGERFDLRRFHDSLLSVGALPLPLIEEHVDWFIARELETASRSAAASRGR